MLGATIAPTKAEASSAVNIIPGRATARVRLPDPSGDARGRDRAGRPDRAGRASSIEFEFIENVGGTLSPADTPLYRALEDFAPEIEAGATLAPIVNAGLHRQPLHARGVRIRRLRLHADADGPAPGRGDSSTRPTSGRRSDDLELAVRCFLHVARTMGEAGVSPPTVRLGGMALRNGILVHSLAHWAAAVRTDDGEVMAWRPAGRRTCPTPSRGMPLLRGVARMAEAALLLPARPAAPARGAAAGRGAGDGRRAGRLGDPRPGRAAEPAASARRRVARRGGGARPGAHGASGLGDRRLPRRRAQGDRGVREGHRRLRRDEGARALRVAHGRARSWC